MLDVGASGSVAGMYVVGLALTVTPIDAAAPITPDAVTDMVEAIVDRLDEQGLVPDVGAEGFGPEVKLRIEVLVADDSEARALVSGVTAIEQALEAAGIEPEGMGSPSHLEPSVKILEPA